MTRELRPCTGLVLLVDRMMRSLASCGGREYFTGQACLRLGWMDLMRGVVLWSCPGEETWMSFLPRTRLSACRKGSPHKQHKRQGFTVNRPR